MASRKLKVFGLKIWESEKSDTTESRNFTNDMQAVIYEMMTGMNAAVVTEESSISFSAVWACVRVLSESVAILPINIMQIENSGRRVPAKSHDLYSVIRKRPNKLMTAYTFWSTVVVHLCLYGNAYIRINREPRTFKIKELIILNPKKMVCGVVKNDMIYLYDGTPLTSSDLLHFKGFSLDGITGKSPIAVARENIGLGMSAQTFGKKFFDNGARPTGAFTSPTILNDAQFARQRTLIDKMYSGAQNAGRPLLLEGGMKFEPFSIPPDDAQFLQTRKFSIEEICRLYRVPPHMIASLDRSTNNNIEMQDTEFWRDAVAPYCKNIEEELNLKLLTESESENFYFNFNMKGMMRGDMASRASFYQMLFNSGALSPNDILRLEDMNGYEGGDDKYLQLNLTPVQLLTKSTENGQN